MKNNVLLFALLACSLAGCGQANEAQVSSANNQTAEITVDGKRHLFSEEAILSLSFIAQTHLGFAILSEKNDLQFQFTAFLTDLKPGTYTVWDCKSASSCTQEEDDKNQSAGLAPYPKDPMPPLNLSRTAYNAPDLGLQPLTLTIASVTDDQQEGMPYKTKRVKGHYSGVLAYVEKGDAGWKIVGNTTKVDGSFDMYCGIR